MKRILFLIFLQIILVNTGTSQNWIENKTFSYSELIQAYLTLSNTYQEGTLMEVGISDIGKPLHLFVISSDGETDIQKLKKSNKRIVFINNGIHAGEACGIDASFELAKKVLDPTNSLNKLLHEVVIVIIPIYNVGGMLTRGSFSRANQNGPEAYGFRGNAKNLDLNRDFIKCDSKNAAVFNQVYSAWDPDIFVDTHTTNGSDHQYTLTIIASQKDKQNPFIQKFQTEKMTPTLFLEMGEKNMDITPYIYSMKGSPESGIMDFLETPRFSSGYATLFNCFSFITEAHVYKPYSDRVVQTEAFLETILWFTKNNTDEIKAARSLAAQYEIEQNVFPLSWELDTTKYIKQEFRGYDTETRESELTHLEMRFYDTSKPYKKSINYYNSYKSKVEVSKPKFYLIPQAYSKIIERLSWNKIELTRLKKDTQINITCYYIEDFKTGLKPYEAHFLHRDVQVRKEVQTLTFYAGDYLVPTAQKNIRYLIETLEPQGVDSYFAWNFFDGILQQKEWFSDYAFEPKAKKILKENRELRLEFEAKQINDSSFAKNNFAQLYYIYKRSKYFEQSAFRYPIFRVE